MEKILNIEKDCEGDVDCPEVMGPCCLISEEEVVSAIKGLKWEKQLVLLVYIWFISYSQGIQFIFKKVIKVKIMKT